MVKSQCVSNGDLNGTEDQIKHMVDRFLGWRLPENFNPDGGVSFQRTFGENTPWPRKAEPVGTNLLDAQQAEQMVRYMIEGLPVSAEAGVSRCGDEGQDMDRRRDTGGACDVSDSRKVTYRAFGLVDGRGEVIRIVEEHYVYTGNYQEACKVASALQSKEPK